MWLLFPSAGLMRTLSLQDAKQPTPADQDRATRLFGTDAWREIYEARKEGELEPIDAREEYVNLMRWLLEQDLGYARTHALELVATNGPIYHMIFATDHPAGDEIMEYLYNDAANQIPRMREHALQMRRQRRQEEKGVMFLFDLDPPGPVSEKAKLYEHYSPREPFLRE